MFAGNGHGNQGERQAMFHVKPWQSCSGFVIETTQVPGGWDCGIAGRRNRPFLVRLFIPDGHQPLSSGHLPRSGHTSVWRHQRPPDSLEESSFRCN